MIEKDEQLSPESTGSEETKAVEQNPAPAEKVETEVTPAPSESEPVKSEEPSAESAESPAEAKAKGQTEESPGETQEAIDEANAEDAEDDDNNRRHQIPLLDYDSLSMENLVGELQRLVRTEKVQAINTHVNQIKRSFDQQFKSLFEEKKEEFLENGGNEIDFRFSSVSKRQFNEVYKEYREKRDAYYKNLEKQLESNLQDRLAIIEELKSLINVEEDMNNTYQYFKALQEKWRNAGPVPRNQYNDVWRTYHHHTEIFYDFLHLNRELRDLDFKHNLEEKQKLVERAEGSVQEPDLSKAFF